MTLVTILSFVRNFSAVFLQENLEDRLKKYSWQSFTVFASVLWKRFIKNRWGNDLKMHHLKSAHLSLHHATVTRNAARPVCNRRSTRHKLGHFGYVLPSQSIGVLECGPMPNLMVTLPNIGGALCSTPQSLADAHY